MYKGPWKIQANKRTPKDPTAPKRPMSAFLAFSNKRRAALKRQHPDATNADLSKMLSKTWKEAPEELRRKYMDEEAGLRAKYKELMGTWRTKVAEEKKVERKEREAMALRAAEAMASDRVNMTSDSNFDDAARNFESEQHQRAAIQHQHQLTAAGIGGGYGNMYGGAALGDLGALGLGSAGFPGMLGSTGYAAQSIMGGSVAQQQLINQLLANQQYSQAGLGRGLGMLGQSGFPGHSGLGQPGMSSFVGVSSMGLGGYGASMGLHDGFPGHHGMIDGGGLPGYVGSGALGGYGSFGSSAVDGPSRGTQGSGNDGLTDESTNSMKHYGRRM
jgi:hypothetical protein